MYEPYGGYSMILDERRHRMSLDFATSQRKCFYQPPPPSTAAAADKVTSPDLESFLLYGVGGESDCASDTISTPTQILFPKSVTAEQEAYARGFVDALEDLHRRQGVPVVTGLTPSVVCTTQPSSSLYPTSNDAVRWSASYPSISSAAAAGHNSSVSSPGSSVGGHKMRDVDQPSRLTDDDGGGGGGSGVQTVPRLSCLTPPSSPDVDACDLARIDRKRERNRLAAQKCRSRKLEQIAVLESRCALLRSENETLSRMATQLENDVDRLRRILAEHTAGAQCLFNDTITSTSAPEAL